MKPLRYALLHFNSSGHLNTQEFKNNGKEPNIVSLRGFMIQTFNQERAFE